MTSQWMQMCNSLNRPDKCWWAQVCNEKKFFFNYIYKKNNDETCYILYPYHLMVVSLFKLSVFYSDSYSMYYIYLLMTSSI